MQSYITSSPPDSRKQDALIAATRDAWICLAANHNGFQAWESQGRMSSPIASNPLKFHRTRERDDRSNRIVRFSLSDYHYSGFAGLGRTGRGCLIGRSVPWYLSPKSIFRAVLGDRRFDFPRGWWIPQDISRARDAFHESMFRENAPALGPHLTSSPPARRSHHVAI